MRSSIASSKQIVVAAARSANEDDITGRAAQLAYYFFLSLFPGIMFLTALLGIISKHGPHLQNELLRAISVALPGAAFGTVQGTYSQITQSSSGGLFTFGVAGALWSATAGMSAVQDTLNSVYKVTEGRPFWKRNLLALALTMGVMVLGIIAIVLFFFGSTLVHLLHSHRDLDTVAALLWRAAEWVFTIFLMSVIFALVYYAAPDVAQRRWRWITPGAITGIVAWVLASLAFRLYLHYFDSYSKTYGSMGAVIVLLLWFYASGFALLFGAEINSAIENRKAKQGDPTAKEKGQKVPRIDSAQ